MTLKTTRRSKLTITPGAFLAALMAPSPAHSDLKIVTEINVTKSPQPTQTASKPGTPQIEIAYYKDREARVEAADGTVTIYDRAADKLYTLNPADRTYHVAPIKKVLEPGSDQASQISTDRRMKLESKVDLKADDPAQKRTVAGREAIRYSLTGSATMKRESGGGFSRGGFPGGSGYPGGGFPGGGKPGGGGRRGGGSGANGSGRPSFQIEGEYWIAPALPIAPKTKNALLPTIAEKVSAGPFLSPLSARLAKIKGFPVASKVTVTTSSRQSPTPITVTTTTEVKSITDGPLDASLFKVPDRYREVEPQTHSAPQRAVDARP